MARGEYSSGRSELQLAIERSLRDSAALMIELQRFEDADIRTEAEAEAVSQAAALLASKPEQVEVQGLSALVRLFHSVRRRKTAVFRILAEQGIPSLVKLARHALDQPTDVRHSDVFWILPVLARYRTRAGTATVLRAARMPVQPDSFGWHAILCEFARHPHRKWLYQRLCDPIPPDFPGHLAAGQRQ